MLASHTLIATNVVEESYIMIQFWMIQPDWFWFNDSFLNYFYFLYKKLFKWGLLSYIKESSILPMSTGWYFTSNNFQIICDPKFFSISLKISKQFCQMFIFYWCNMCGSVSSPIIRICLDIRKKLHVWSGIFLVQDDNYFSKKLSYNCFPVGRAQIIWVNMGEKLGK